MSSEIESSKMDEIMRAAGYLEAANNLLAQRFNYALVAHSMALAAYSASSGTSRDQFVQVAVAVFGLFYAVVQRQITAPMTKRIDALRNDYLVNDPVYQSYHTAPDAYRLRGLQSQWVPAALGLLWGSLFLHAIC